MSVPLDRYLDGAERERRFIRDLANQLGEAIDNARIALADAFCGDAAFDLDANNEPVIVATAEKTIDRALSPLWRLQDDLSRKGGRA
jgi:hypothetical protein